MIDCKNVRSGKLQNFHYAFGKFNSGVPFLFSWSILNYRNTSNKLNPQALWNKIIFQRSWQSLITSGNFPAWCFSLPPPSKKNSSWTAWPLKMGPLGCPETSVTNYQPKLCNILEGIRPQTSLHFCDQWDYFRIYNSTASLAVLSQLNSVHNILHYSGNLHFNIPPPFACPPNRSLNSVFSEKGTKCMVILVHSNAVNLAV